MTGVARHLIVKDLYLQRRLIGVAFIGGVISLVITGIAGQAGIGFGLVFYLTTVIGYGIVLVMNAVTLERNQKSLVFALSLPISPEEYLQAKMWAMLLAFVGPWALLTLTTMIMIATTSIPDGMIPYLAVVSILMLMNFCVVLAAALISRSDPIITLIIIVTNASVSVLFILMSSIPSLKDLANRDVLAWPPAALEIMGFELAVTLIAVALPFAMRRAGRGLFSQA
jgi:hypothetical protein